MFFKKLITAYSPINLALLSHCFFDLHLTFRLGFGLKIKALNLQWAISKPNNETLLWYLLLNRDISSQHLFL